MYPLRCQTIAKVAFRKQKHLKMSFGEPKQNLKCSQGSQNMLSNGLLGAKISLSALIGAEVLLKYVHRSQKKR